MLKFFEALVSYFKADPMAGSLTGLYNTEAPQNAVFPYVVFTLPTAFQDDTFGEEYETLTLQFNIYSSNPSVAEVWALYSLLIGDEDLGVGFDYAEFDIDGYNLLKMERQNINLSRWESEGVRVWDLMVTYQVMLQKE